MAPIPIRRGHGLAPASATVDTCVVGVNCKLRPLDRPRDASGLCFETSSQSVFALQDPVHSLRQGILGARATFTGDFLRLFCPRSLRRFPFQIFRSECARALNMFVVSLILYHPVLGLMAVGIYASIVALLLLSSSPS
jgi:hypothetical protein